MLKKILFILVMSCYNNVIATDFKLKIISVEENATLKSNNGILNSEEKWKQKATYYRTKLYKSNKKEMLLYSDSLVIAALNSKNNTLIGNAYLTKGIAYYNQKQLQKALDNYLIADEYLSQTKDLYAKYKVKYTIAQTKYYLGFYYEAIVLFKECISYYEQENERAYLNSIHAIGLCFNKIGKYDSCTYYNNLGLTEGIELQNPEMIAYFYHSEGVNQFFKKNYTTSIKKLLEVLPVLKKKNDFANETVVNFYIGQNYKALNEENKAIPYFLKVDKAFIEKQYVRPDIRRNYELLIDFYKKQNDPKLELQYINRLLKVDSILNQNYKYLSQKIFKEYDTKKLIQEKKEIEESLKFNNKTSYIVIASLVSALGIVTVRQQRNKKKYNERFNELMNKSSQTQKPNNNNATLDIDISPDIVAMVVQQLEKFEKNKRYLEREMNLNKLATILKTNPKYASKIIYKHRNKKIIEYISDLKIDHIIELLKTENKYRNYTNKALSEEVGFGSTQNFTKAFKAKTGISPTYFILELNKIK